MAYLDGAGRCRRNNGGFAKRSACRLGDVGDLGEFGAVGNMPSVADFARWLLHTRGITFNPSARWRAEFVRTFPGGLSIVLPEIASAHGYGVEAADLQRYARDRGFHAVAEPLGTGGAYQKDVRVRVSRVAPGMGNFGALGGFGADAGDGEKVPPLSAWRRGQSALLYVWDRPGKPEIRITAQYSPTGTEWMILLGEAEASPFEFQPAWFQWGRVFVGTGFVPANLTQGAGGAKRYGMAGSAQADLAKFFRRAPHAADRLFPIR